MWSLADGGDGEKGMVVEGEEGMVVEGEEGMVVEGEEEGSGVW